MDTKGKVRPDEYPDNNIDGLVLVIDAEKHTYWLTIQNNSPAMLQGKLGEVTFHYNTPRGADFDGYFTGTLHVSVKIPFTKAVYSPVLDELIGSINNQQSKDTKMQKENVTDAVIVEETPAVANSRPTSTLITTVEKDGVKLELYYYDPVKHAAIKNPKKDLSGLSRKDRRHWNSERDRYVALMSGKKEEIPPVVKQETKQETKQIETIEPTKEPKTIVVDKNKAPIRSIPSSISNMTKGYLSNLVGKSAELMTVEDLDMESAAFLGFEKEGVWNILQFPVLEKDEVIFMSFPKSATAEFWLSEMRKVPKYKAQLEGIIVVPRNQVSQKISKDATLLISNVKELLERLHQPKKEV